MPNELPGCARCSIVPADRTCQKEGGKAPSGCPTLSHTDAVAASLQEYEKPEVGRFARQASVQEGEGYGGRDQGYEKVRPIKPRIEETIEFARRMGTGAWGWCSASGCARKPRSWKAC